MSSSDNSGSYQGNKNIILCFDGTDNTFGPNPFSNVLKIYRMLDSSNSERQICYYQPGIGSSLEYDSNVTFNGLFSWKRLKMTLDSAIAYSLDHHIVSAYTYLMHHYEPGDKIIMFGFSRGAFTARILTGMLEMVGLLNIGLDEIVWMAWKIYEAWEYAARPVQPCYTTTLVEEFKKTFSRNVDIEIHFQGLFDSVNSCGILRDRLFPYTARSGIVRHIRHAVSIDERRGKLKQQSFSPNPYRPNLFSLNYRNYVVERENIVPRTPYYTSSNNHFINHTIGSHPNLDHSDESIQDLISRINTYLEVDHTERSDNFLDQQVEGIFQVNSPSDTFNSNRMSLDLVEKWFPGDHSDVGGSWPPDISEANHFLSDISLRWILSEAIRSGVLFKKGIVHEFAKKYTSAGSLVSASHDLLSFKKSIFTMKSPFQNGETNNVDKDKMDRYHGFQSQKRKQGWFSFPWSRDENKECFRTFDLRDDSLHSINDIEQSIETSSTHNSNLIKKKHDGSGNVGLLQVLFWWISELIPIGIRIENEKCQWRNVYVPNFGRRRNIPECGDLHWSVYWRIKLVDDYRPKNLPDYCVDLIKDYENVSLPKKKNTKSDILKQKQSQLQHHDHESEQLRPPESIDNQCNCEKDDINKIKEKLSESLIDWGRNNWEIIPDDLDELLKENPEL